MPAKLWNRNFTLLTFSNFFMCSAYYSLISTLPLYISNELHSPKSVVGLVLASYIVASVLVRPFTGYGLDKYGRKTIFIVSLLLYALVFNGYLIAWTVTVMVLVRFAHGLTWGLTTTSNSTVAVDIIPSFNLLLIMITYGGMLSFVALYGRELGIHNPAGFFLIYATGVIGARFTSGKFFDRHGPRMILLICLSLLIAGFPVLALLQNPAGFYGAAVILGFGNGVVFPTFQAMINNMVPQNRRGAANSTLFTSVDIGMGAGMILVGSIAQQFSISTAFVVCSGICVIAFLFFLFFTSKYYEKNKLSLHIEERVKSGIS